jgi:hypothetical protein
LKTRGENRFLHFTDAAATPRLIRSESQLSRSRPACLCISAQILPKKWAKAGKNLIKPQKPVETRVFLLTKRLKRRKVNGGGFSRTRINTGFQAAAARLRQVKCGEERPCSDEPAYRFEQYRNQEENKWQLQ